MPARVTQTALEVLRPRSSGARVTQAALEVMRTRTYGSRVTQAALEVLRPRTRGGYLTQAALEVLREAPTDGAFVTQAALEVLRSVTHGGRVTQAAVEVMRSITYGGRVTQAAVEVMRSKPPIGARATQVALEVLRERRRGAFLTQAVVEVLRVGEQYGGRVSQAALEVLRRYVEGSRVTQTALEVLRENSNEAIITQSVAEILRANKPIAQYTSVVQPWPFPANAAYELIEEYGYLSEVLRSQSGAEQRRLLRDTPSGRVTFTCTLTTAREIQYASVLLSSCIGTPLGVPLWQYKQTLATDHGAGATEIAVDTTRVPFYVGGLAMLWSSPFNWELVLIYEVTSTLIALSEPLQKTWVGKQTAILPVVVGYLREREEQGRHSPKVGDHELTFDVPAYFP